MVGVTLPIGHPYITNVPDLNQGRASFNTNLERIMQGLQNMALEVNQESPLLTDDLGYEEGTWNPVPADAGAGGVAGSAGLGSYVKCMDLVYVQFRILNVDTTGMTPGNDFYIRGLPYPTPNILGVIGGGCLAHMNQVTFTTQPYYSLISNNTYFRVRVPISAVNGTFMKISDLSSGVSDFRGSFIYRRQL